MTSSRIGAVACLLVVVGPVLAWLRIVPALAGFAMFGLGGLLAIAVGLWTVVRAIRGKGVGAGGAAAIAVAVVFVVLALRRGDAPRINDFTTDATDPPTFVHATTLPANVGRDMSYPPSFAEIQQQCCDDLRPVRLAVPPVTALAAVHQAALKMPDWTVTNVDAAAGTMEAIATTRLFHFQDDIVIRVRPDGDAASRVDMRSKSRDGKGDMGTNAARIRAFVALLSPRAAAP